VTLNKEFKPLVEKAVERGRVTKVYADTAYDSRADFDQSTSLNAYATIKPRRGSSRGSYLRA